MSEKYKMTPEDEAAFRCSALEQVALRIVFVGERPGVPQTATEPVTQESYPATVDESVTIEAKEE